MRNIFLMIVACTMFTAGPAAAAWQAYENEAHGYSLTFPSAPSESAGTYKSDLLAGAPTHVVSAKDGDASFFAIEIQTGQPEEGAPLMAELEYWLNQIARVVANDVSRLNVGMQYGRVITLDCADNVALEGPKQAERARTLFKDAANITCPTGARMMVTLYFTRGRLYAFIAVVAGENAKTSNAPIRFINSLNWLGANADHARDMLLKAHPEMANPAPGAPGLPGAGLPPPARP